MAATLNRNKQVEAANARVAALEGELAACQNKTAGLEEEAKGKEGKMEFTYFSVTHENVLSIQDQFKIFQTNGNPLPALRSPSPPSLRPRMKVTWRRAQSPPGTTR